MAHYSQLNFPDLHIDKIRKRIHDMTMILRTALALLTAGLLTSAAGFGTSEAATPKASKDILIVNLAKFCGPYYCPAMPKVWGVVTVEYRVNGSVHSVGKCRQVTCRYGTPHMMRLYLVQKPKNRAKWPFKEWKVTTAGRTSTRYGSKMSFAVRNGKATVAAIYKLRTRR
jgi:hypothetical protein